MKHFLALLILSFNFQALGLDRYIDQDLIKKDFNQAASIQDYKKCEDHLLLAMSNCTADQRDICEFISELGTIALNKKLPLSSGMRSDLNQFFKHHYNLDFINNSKDKKTIKEFKQVHLLEKDKKALIKSYRSPAF